ncbi:MAG: hypothetical protein ACI9MB_005087 [Verrucomicrobiales bacterium]|jgi:hypothetical protein
MKTTPTICFLAALLITPLQADEGAKNHPAKDDKSFTTIFDGKDMSKIQTTGNWKIQDDGSLHLTPRAGEKGWTRYGSYIWLKEDYADFTFDFEFKYEKGGNSGLYFRCADDVDPTKSGFEVQILDCYGKEKFGQHDMGGVIQTAGATKNMSKKPGEWNRMTVTMKGDLLKVVLNGEVVQDINLAEKKPKDKALVAKGKISIQDHGQPFTVRNLRVKKL